jgi:6-methylsalicylate decarboxylase
LQNSPIAVPPAVRNATKIDTHVHAVPSFYFDIMPVKPGSWSIERHLEHMANLSIAHAVLSIPWPGASVYAGNQSATTALARILNEYLGQLSRIYPNQFSYVAVVPLPYADSAFREVCCPLLIFGV